MSKREVFVLVVSAGTDFAVTVMTAMLSMNVQHPTRTMIYGGTVAFLRTVQQTLKKPNGQ